MNTSPHTNELVRPRNGRIVAGVATGLADRLGVSAAVVRAGFVLLTLAGGGGVALYLLGWVAIRSDDERLSPVQRWLCPTSLDAESESRAS